MHAILIDDRHNQRGGCATCCCEPISLRAGETQLVTLNYAAWTIPIMANGGPGLIPTPQISIVEDATSCHNDAIDGFAAPATGGDIFVEPLALAINTTLTLDLTDDVTPANNAFEFTLHPVSGPYHGSLTASPLSGTSWVYEPAAGFTGYDQFWVKINDAQGRTIIRPVNINIGAATTIPPKGWGPAAAMGLQVDRSKLKVNSNLQTISFAIYMPPANDAETIDACRRYRATIKAFARDCDEEYTHITCIDVTSAGC